MLTTKKFRKKMNGLLKNLSLQKGRWQDLVFNRRFERRCGLEFAALYDNG